WSPETKAPDDGEVMHRVTEYPAGALLVLHAGVAAAAPDGEVRWATMRRGVATASYRQIRLATNRERELALIIVSLLQPAYGATDTPSRWVISGAPAASPG